LPYLPSSNPWSSRIIDSRVWENPPPRRKLPTEESREEFAGLLQDRKKAKRPIMTMLYGVTSIGIQRQLRTLFTQEGLDKKRADDLAHWLELFYSAVRDTVPEIAILRELCRSLSRLDKPLVYQSDLLEMTIFPLARQESIITLLGRRVTVRQSLPQMDGRKIATSSPANLTHAGDAWVAHKFLELLRQSLGGTSPCLMVHDQALFAAPLRRRVLHYYRQAYLDYARRGDLRIFFQSLLAKSFPPGSWKIPPPGEENPDFIPLSSFLS
jgi:hypothetical protein